MPDITVHYSTFALFSTDRDFSQGNGPDENMTEPQQFLIYQSEDGSTRIDVMLEAETLWLSQKQLTELFGKAKGTISEHIKHIFDDGELTPAATVRLFRTVQSEGGRENI